MVRILSLLNLLWQPAIYVTSLATVEILRAPNGGQDIIDYVDVTCGLSVGEYTTLAFAGSFRCLFFRYVNVPVL